MKHADDAIEKVLEGLRNCHPPAGMEARILRAAQDRAAAKSSFWHRWQPLLSFRSTATRALNYGAAVTCTVAILLTPLVLRHKQTAAVTIRTPDSISVASSRAPAISSLSPTVPLTRAISNNRPRKTTKAKPVDDEDAVALSDTQAASFPAPPMPLTDQEKLLLRIAHARDPIQLAMLDPALRARANAADRAQFQQFFEPSTPGENQ